MSRMEKMMETIAARMEQGAVGNISAAGSSNDAAGERTSASFENDATSDPPPDPPTEIDDDTS